MSLPLLALLLAPAPSQVQFQLIETRGESIGILHRGILPVGDAAYGVLRSGSLAHRWTAAAGLMPYPGPPEVGARGFMPSATDEVCATAWMDPQLGREVPARWSVAAGLEVLGLVPGGGAWAAAFGISADAGTIIGTYAYPPANSNWLAPAEHGFVWSHVLGYRDLGDLPGGDDQSSARLVSADGAVVVGVSATGGGSTPSGADVVDYTPFRWTAATGMVPLLGGAVNASVSAISADGTLVLVSRPWLDLNDDEVTQAQVIAVDGTQLTLTNARSSVGLGMSGDGDVVVGQADDLVHPIFGTGSGAFIWEPGQDAILLVDALAGWGAQVPPGWELTVATGVSADGNVIFGSARGASSEDAGFVATLRSPDWPLGEELCVPAISNSTGAPASLRLSGLGYTPSNLLNVDVSGVSPGATVLLLASRTEGFDSQHGGSSGNLCLGGAIGRFLGPGQVQAASASGSVRWPIDTLAIPTPMGPNPIMPGETVYFQAWYRDANPLLTSNFTNAVGELFE